MKAFVLKHRLLVEILVIVILITVILGAYYRAVRYKHTGSGGGFDNFYALDVPVDVMIFGSSHAACTVNNGLLWEERGVASYTLSAGNQSIDGEYFFLQEAVAKHKPKIALIETYTFCDEVSSLDALYRTILTSRWSERYLSYILKKAREEDYGLGRTVETVLKFPIVHTRYNELERGDFYNNSFYNRGYQGSDVASPLKQPAKTEERLPELPESTRYYMEQMVELGKKEGVELVFFTAPFRAKPEEIAAQNSVKDYCEELGVPYIGFLQDPDAYGIDWETDFREYSHLNDSGADKITRALAEYLSAHYDIPDRREEPGYEDWDLHAEYLAARKDTYRLLLSEDPENYINTLAQLHDQYTVVVSLNGNYDPLGFGYETYGPYLEALGIDKDSFDAGGVFVFRGGEMVYRSEGAGSYQYYCEMKYDADLNVYKAEEEEFGHVEVNGRDCSHGCNGLWISVYDENCMYVVDDAYLDIYNEQVMLRKE